MVKISVISVEGLKEDSEKKGEKLPEPEFLTDIPLYEKRKLETIDDLATVKNPKKRCKGLAIILALVILAITCLCLATVVYTISEEKEEHAQETRRFECDIMFRDPDDEVPERQIKLNVEIDIEIEISNDIKRTKRGTTTMKPMKTTENQANEKKTTENRHEPTTQQHRDKTTTTDHYETLLTEKRTTPRYPTTRSINPIASPTTDKQTADVVMSTEGNVKTTEYGHTTADHNEQTTSGPETTTLKEQPITSSYSTLNPHLHHMKEEIIVNVENNTEVFSIPATDDHEAIMILHDFTNRYTAYLLVEKELCFVKDIHPLLMHPFYLLQALLNPVYFLQEYFVTHDTFIAVTPPLDSLSMFGGEIDNMCHSVPTFWLEEMNDEYETVDITELPWWDWGYPEWYNRRRRSVKGEHLKSMQYFDSNALVRIIEVKFRSLSKKDLAP